MKFVDAEGVFHGSTLFSTLSSSYLIRFLFPSSLFLLRTLSFDCYFVAKALFPRVLQGNSS